MLFLLNLHFSGLRVTPASWIRCWVVQRQMSLLIMVSSKYQHIVQVTEHPVIAYKDCTDPMLNVLWSTADAKC